MNKVKGLGRKILLVQRVNQALNLSARTRDCLDRAEIVLMRELIRKRPSELMQIKGFGRKSLNELRTKLARLGLSLNEEH